MHQKFTRFAIYGCVCVNIAISILHIDMGLEAVLPGPQNALYVCYVYMYRQWDKT